MSEMAGQEEAIAVLFGVMGVFYVLIIVFLIVIYWQIWSKAGYSGAWALLMIVPLANIVALIVLAFSDWPVRQRLRALEGASGGQSPPGGQSPISSG